MRVSQSISAEMFEDNNLLSYCIYIYIYSATVYVETGEHISKAALNSFTFSNFTTSLCEVLEVSFGGK